MEWQIKSRAPKKYLGEFSQFPSLIAQLLYNRGLKTKKQIEEFFNPDYRKDIYNPYLLKDMKKAVKRIVGAIKKREKITVYGDFDADGVCSTAILMSVLKICGADNLDRYIPDRDTEGHGLNNEAVEEITKKGTKLIITVDCGSTDFDEVALANKLGVDVIITDHHQVLNKVPRAVALVNPHKKDDKYPFKYLSGAGVAYKLACALVLSKEINVGERKGNYVRKNLLELVALATVSDVMPIIGENRTLVKYGLAALAQTSRPGLKKLMEVSQVSPQVIGPAAIGRAPLTNLNCHTIGFVLGPRLNAASRMDHANTAFELLVEENEEAVDKLANQLNRLNTTRQNLVGRIVAEVDNRFLEKSSRSKKTKIIFEKSQDWPVGIIGLVSGKITDKYHRPSFICQEKNNMIFGSCRSIPHFDLMSALKKCADLFDDFGGHKEAAGFQLKKSNLLKLRLSLEKIADKEIKDEELTPILEIDAELSLKDINMADFNNIQMFAPFGPGNKEPKFLAKNLEVVNLRTVGNGAKHLKMELMMFNDESTNGKTFKAIGFGLANWQDKIKEGDLIDAVFNLILDEWNGYKDLQMKIIDLKPVV